MPYYLKSPYIYDISNTKEYVLVRPITCTAPYKNCEL